MQNVVYTQVLYRFIGSSHLDGSIVSGIAGEDIPEGAVVEINSSGQVVKCALAGNPLGVSRQAAKAGTTVTIENDCLVEQKGGTSLALTVGAPVYTAAGGTVSSTKGTNAKQIGISLSADRIKISL